MVILDRGSNKEARYGTFTVHMYNFEYHIEDHFIAAWEDGDSVLMFLILLKVCHLDNFRSSLNFRREMWKWIKENCF